MNREHAIAHACEYAKMHPESYYAEPFVPHEWVIQALMNAPFADWVERFSSSQQARDEELPNAERLEIAMRLAWDELQEAQRGIYLMYADSEIRVRCADCHGSGEQFHQAHRGEETVFEGMINCQSCGGTGVKK